MRLCYLQISVSLQPPSVKNKMAPGTRVKPFSKGLTHLYKVPISTPFSKGLIRLYNLPTVIQTLFQRYKVFASETNTMPFPKLCEVKQCQVKKKPLRKTFSKVFCSLGPFPKPCTCEKTFSKVFCSLGPFPKPCTVAACSFSKEIKGLGAQCIHPQLPQNL